MKYRVHRCDFDRERPDGGLEKLLNGLDGEVVSIIPHTTKPSLGWIYGLKQSVDFVLIVERVS